MSRRVTKTAKGPFELKPQDRSVFICMCGLSKNQPFCDSSHKKVLDEEEGKMYEYDENGKRIENCCKEEECCGGKCCSEKEE